MPTINQITFSSDGEIKLHPSAARKFRGLRIPGGTLHESVRDGHLIYLHSCEHELFRISLKQLTFPEKSRLVISEPGTWLRLYVVLGGSVKIVTASGLRQSVNAGSYRFHNDPLTALEFENADPVILISFHLSPELLQSLGAAEPIKASAIHQLPQAGMDMIYEILKSPFVEKFRDFYFANKLREILFLHVASGPVLPPGELSATQVAQVYEADRIMAAHLEGHITIPQLARQLGTNFVTLKRNYEKVFGVGIFNRFMQRKMDHITVMLERTDKPLKEIADQAGYQTLPGFINAFRKRFGVTPNEWRKQRKG